MIAMLFAIAPALTGALLIQVFMRAPYDRAWLRRISFAAGMLFGEMLFACLLFLAPTLGVNPLTEETLFILAALLGVLVLIRFVQIHRVGPATSLQGAVLQLTDWLFVPVIWICLSLLWSHPLFGWDTTSVWAHNSVHYIQTLNNFGIDGAELHEVVSKHPSTLSLLIAWSGWLASVFETSTPIVAIGLLPWAAMSLSLSALCICMGLERRLIVFVSYALLGLPLLENHYLVSGYAEAWLAAMLLLIAIAVAIALKNGAWGWVFLILLTSPVLSLLKYGGFLFSIAAALTLGLAYLCGHLAQKKISIAVLAASMCAAVLLLVLFLISIPSLDQLLGRQFNINIGGVANPVVEGLMLNDPLVVITNEVYSLLLNGSFSVMFLVLLILTAKFLCDFRVAPLELTYMAFSMILPWAVLAVPVAWQLFSEYGLYYSLPTRDTGNSRVKILFAPLVLNCLVVSLGRQRALKVIA
jgi:hypothetical protein